MIDFESLRRHAFLLLAAGTLVVGAQPGFAQAEQQQEATPPSAPAAAGKKPKQQALPPNLSAEQQAMLREARAIKGPGPNGTVKSVSSIMSYC